MSHVHWLALTYIPSVGGATVRRLLERFGSVEAVFAADPAELASVPRLSERAIAALQAISFETIEAELATLAETGLILLTWDAPAYPGSLHDLSDPPPVLFVRGALLPEDERAVAIVGSRRASDYGLAIARRLGQALAAQGLTVISGLALGIDTAAHEGALEASRGRTLAVLGSGLRVIHPRENRVLAERIVARGALLSELRPEAPPRGSYLMARDRIIAALSRAVVVVEAEEGSGSLDTARRAQRLGRPVLACPGSHGTEALLQAGAECLILETADLNALAERLQHPPEPPPAARQRRLF
ncbi:MAG: DNA-processing protein DprA [Chloroflexota bacterium]|nr:DNA-processing protein DprA [Chloroflexota bacterium]